MKVTLWKHVISRYRNATLGASGLNWQMNLMLSQFTFPCIVIKLIGLGSLQRWNLKLNRCKIFLSFWQILKRLRKEILQYQWFDCSIAISWVAALMWLQTSSNFSMHMKVTLLEKHEKRIDLELYFYSRFHFCCPSRNFHETATGSVL